MSITRVQFYILELLAIHWDLQKRHLLKGSIHYSNDEVEHAVRELSALGYIESETITKLGLNALEPYRVSRAVFIAAGFGSRLAPITFNTPKPLVRVHGVRIIDHLIDACLAA